ncbi:MAG: 50S ribosomal protein L18 [Candidatus Curtissbacteria bacterium GW2011_GWA1_40_9]|uniref:Large ribosomal subunit protein uL18 n=1 Tax=Candidatus Curtissbacteria bacterium GW2011_GWA1_40_9 TaxID=1618408 RepID=A0A0G0TM02_9BACT|nr:MAG: 50S ribosomal protein L18 [Candidatus Curtissbacteria bacterium GW2011_GWA1_40_9]
MKNKKLQRKIRHSRVTGKIKDSGRFRLVVFRSNKHIYCQLIDDIDSKTIAAASDIKIKSKSKLEKAKETGRAIAKASMSKKVNKVVFDRGGYKYHGRVKALAEGAREGGLVF